MRRPWSLVYAGHFPVITNGWSVAKVAAYERRWAFSTQVRILGRRHGFLPGWTAAEVADVRRRAKEMSERLKEVVA